MKKVLLPALLAASLSACTVGMPGVSVGLGVGTSIGRHVGLGTSINIPVGLDKTKTTKGTDSDGIRISEEQIVTYFDAHGTPSNSAVKGGFHRQLISKRNNEYVVQDFYSDNSQKRTDPYVLSRNQLMQFRATPSNGSLTTYAYNGTLMQQQVFQNGKLVNAKY